jgi:hypothetical protein
MEAGFFGFLNKVKDLLQSFGKKFFLENLQTRGAGVMFWKALGGSFRVFTAFCGSMF